MEMEMEMEIAPKLCFILSMTHIPATESCHGNGHACHGNGNGNEDD